jgi:O-antigen ligase
MGTHTVSTASKYGPAMLLFAAIFVATAFSGSLFGVAAPYLIIAEIAVLLWMNLTPISADRGYFNSRHLLQFGLLVAFCVFLGWQATYAMVPELTLIYLRRFAVFSLLLLLIPNPRTCHLALKASKYYGLLVAVSILVVTVATGTKSGGLVGDYQYGGMMMSVACVLFLVDYFHDGGGFTDIAGFILSLAGVFISGKRMFALIVVVSFVWLYIASVDRGKLPRTLKLTAFGVVSVGTLYAMLQPVRELVGRIGLFLLPAEAATSGRNVLWSLALDIFNANPLTGVGFANFLPYSDAISAAPWFGLFHVHNIYLQLLAETGLVGFALMTVLFISAFMGTWRSYRLSIQGDDRVPRYVLISSLALQVWFLMYGLSGNGLYGWQEMFLYVSAVGMAISVRIAGRTAEPIGLTGSGAAL